jgi:hypothetical protein
VAAAAGRLSPFEAACWRWHWENVTGFSMDSGIAAEEWRGLRLRGPARRIFLLGVSIIYGSEMERQRKAAESEHGKR